MEKETQNEKIQSWSLVETIKVMATLLPIHSQPGKIKYPLCDIIIINITIIIVILILIIMIIIVTIIVSFLKRCPKKI